MNLAEEGKAGRWAKALLIGFLFWSAVVGLGLLNDMYHLINDEIAAFAVILLFGGTLNLAFKLKIGLAKAIICMVIWLALLIGGIFTWRDFLN
jgi:hypothetical protein